MCLIGWRCYRHNVFHVLMLRKYVTDPSHIVDYELLQLDENLSYEESNQIFGEVKTWRNKDVTLVMFLW